MASSHHNAAAHTVVPITLLITKEYMFAAVLLTSAAHKDIAALTTTVTEIQSLVGDTEQDQTQATQLHGTVLPLLTGTKTAQPCAAAPMAYIEESFGQIERLITGNLKAGVVQGEIGSKCV